MTVESSSEDFEGFVSARWLTLARSALLLGASHHEAEDLAQATLVRCYVHWMKVLQAADQDAYVMRMLLNEFNRSRRRLWRQERPTDPMPDLTVADATSMVDGADVIRAALDRLSRQQRETVVLRHFGQLSERQVADTLGVPVGTVKSRLSRAHQQLASDPDLQGLRNGWSS